MKKIFTLTFASLILLFLANPPSANALDASFQPVGTATFTCPKKDKYVKILTNFTNNAPAGSIINLVEGQQDSSGGVSFGDPAKIGDEFKTLPSLFWSIQDELLGPWQVTTSLDPSCPLDTPPKPESNNNLFVLIAVPVITLSIIAAFVLGVRMNRKK